MTKKNRGASVLGRRGGEGEQRWGYVCAGGEELVAVPLRRFVQGNCESLLKQ